MNQAQQQLLQVTRRHFFETCGVGVGKVALSSLLAGGLTNVARAAEEAAGGDGCNGAGGVDDGRAVDFEFGRNDHEGVVDALPSTTSAEPGRAA
jgi:hypothetical protein